MVHLIRVFYFLLHQYFELFEFLILFWGNLMSTFLSEHLNLLSTIMLIFQSKQTQTFNFKMVTLFLKNGFVSGQHFRGVLFNNTSPSSGALKGLTQSRITGVSKLGLTGKKNTKKTLSQVYQSEFSYFQGAWWPTIRHHHHVYS